MTRKFTKIFFFLSSFFFLLSSSFSQNYATIYVYREKQNAITATNFKIYINTLEQAQIPNGGRLEYRIYKEGRTPVKVGIFSVNGISSDNYDNNLILEIKKGNSYYLRGKGKKLEIVSNEEGKREFDNSSNFKGETIFIDDKPFDYAALNNNNSSNNQQSTISNQQSAKPPKIVITDPKTAEGDIISSNEEKIIITGIAGSAIGINEVKINGEDAALLKDGGFTALVPLSKGKNTIKIIASDVNNQTAEETFFIERKDNTDPAYRGGGDPLKGLNVSKPKNLSFGQYYALIIGVDNYSGTWPALKNAVHDAQAVENMLKTKYKFEHVKTLYNSQATRVNIMGEFDWLTNNVTPNDNVFIYYSGHGELKEKLNKGYWVPADASTNATAAYISNSDIQTYLGGIKSKHTLLISDACFSGDIFRGNTVSVPFEESEKYYSEVNALRSRQVLTSGGVEPVMDGGKEGHSVFAYYLLQVLGENSSNYFDASQLFSKIRIPVINNSEQTPILNPVKNTEDEGGQFIFLKK